MITVEKAFEVAIKKTPDYSIISCWETDKFFAFGMLPKGEELFDAGGGYLTVDKKSCEVGAISSTELFVYIKNKIPVDLSEIKQKTGFEEIFVIDYSTLRYDEENGEYVRPCDPRYNNLPISENMEDLCSE